MLKTKRQAVRSNLMLKAVMICKDRRVECFQTQQKNSITLGYVLISWNTLSNNTINSQLRPQTQ